MNNVLLIKTLKRVAYLLPVVFLYLLLNNFFEYDALKDSQAANLKRDNDALDTKIVALNKLKKDYNDRLAFIEANKVNLEVEQEKINKILSKIDSSGFFKSSIVTMDVSKKYINVAKVQVSIETKFKNFNLNAFEDLINVEAKRLGLVYPMKYINVKSGLIWLIILDIKGENNEK